jgi:hypothetical protein
MSAPDLVVEWEAPLADDEYRVLTSRHPGCKPAVHAGDLAVIALDARGETGGYAAGVWRRWWYESAEPTR